jgi:hypothetical protein
MNDSTNIQINTRSLSFALAALPLAQPYQQPKYHEPTNNMQLYCYLIFYHTRYLYLSSNLWSYEMQLTYVRLEIMLYPYRHGSSSTWSCCHSFGIPAYLTIIAHHTYESRNKDIQTCGWYVIIAISNPIGGVIYYGHSAIRINALDSSLATKATKS